MQAGRQRLPDPSELAQEIIDLLSEKQAEEIMLLDVHQVSSFADIFVIASGTSARQLSALVQTLDEDLDSRYLRPRHIEGNSDSGWVLLDFGDVIVHLFSPEQRAFYNLEGLWSRSVPIVRFQ
jgi:ribosome-associated protein